MNNLVKANQYINSFYRPNGYSLHNWRILKKTALIMWEFHLKGGSWNSKIKIPCKEFYFMLLNSDKQLIVNKELLQWEQNKFNQTVREVYLKRGIDLFNSGYLSQSLKCLELVSLIEPVSYKVHFYKALIHKTQNNENLAFIEFDKAQKIAPDYYLTYIKRAELYLELGMESKAIFDIKEALHLKPDNNLAGSLKFKIANFMKSGFPIQKTVFQAA